MDINFNKNHSNLREILDNVCTGNDENEREIERYMKPKNKKTPSKNFMSPTISAKSKILSPKKRVLTDWNENSTNAPHQKSSSLGKKSTFNNLCFSKNQMSKIPTLPSPLLNDDNDENVEVGDDNVVPYDPLTNYLSPRPTFLRYNPNRLRDRVVFNDISDDSTNSSKSTVDSLSFFGGKGCLIEEKEADDYMEEVIEDEEEVIEERKWGLKWEIAKCLMVFCVLIVSSMYITSMNMNGSLFNDHKYGNITTGLISSFENDQICVESDRIMGYGLSYENEIDVSGASLLGNVVDQGLKRENDEIVKSETSPLVDLDLKCQVGEILAHVFFEGIEEKDVDFEVKLNDGREVQNVDDEQHFEAGLACEEVNVEFEVMDEDEVVALVGEYVDLETKSNDGGLELQSVANVDLEVVGEEVNVDLVGEEVDFEAEVIGKEARGEIGLNDEEETISFVGEDEVEYEQNETTMQNSKSVVMVLVLSLMTLIVPFLVKFYYKPNKTSSNTSNVKKLCSQKPPKVVEEKLEPIQIGDSYLDSLSIAHLRDETVEITPTLTTRVIPKVKLLCEFDVVAEARSSSKKEEERMVINKRNDFDMTSSHLQASMTISDSTGSFISKEMTSNEHVKEETMTKETATPLRRSSRLRSRGVTSP